MINVFCNYYEDSNPIRRAEVDFCIYKNCNNSLINFIILQSQDRLKFTYFFHRINQLTSENDINIICNSDIYFDETVLLANKMEHNEAYALSRWDVQPNGEVVHFNRADSQDTWIFKGNIKNINADFYLGWRGCDNALSDRIEKAGYKLKNPSKSIKTYHLHTSNIRNYSSKNNDHLVPGPYKTVPPCSL